ncbi:MAG: alanine--tRNA ligase [Candidatus Aenigmarchaeota archaeon CG_4_10_14_0_8_um_filter_37_24]|nr:alanine--tRNA ligase [Candidatus Aenigmarchaeota archaeon]OIN85350.1 MAG: alanine--tRNA ligase [Candidatus Aenigmarchaeota archaeon CG1_02_38_14]PIV69136.1 MAG: alanine--tRNA ligase [Candidatus Aenigmarchaeota archaeon CG01_land_8_20_14_3_00_37_9]PIW41252.1 MAG: alanine--tRNA ligase [Candidatus Aenigmarchaeota archaeon CG15_BIG_FIL_POST_REV_8_21_14_020_37_27]PIX51169.1 MAG: alanine--tRNA ligase [Candidatus Aenigmarchaeota archaeon CG_4_8_14_3_um_filter_37_24]PIY36492.1 MAG: alanine--tRNA li
MPDKKTLRKQFQKDWEKYYKIDFLVNKGFQRKICPKCGKGYWTADPERNHCPDQPCQDYEFLGNPPTQKRFSYIESWQEIEKFFKQNGHTSVKQYPIVCRWRPDLFFTIASIIDFQRVEKGQVVFQMPANPLIVPQFCLRFPDIPNVGVTGKHYTNFCMVGQHSIYDGKQGYWKEKCIELDYNLLTQTFGIPQKEVVFVEDLWVGYGAFGSSMEYFVKGIELGNAVFTEFIENNGVVKEMTNKVIDMGAGLERFPWLCNGTPTSYDIVFGPVLKKLKEQAGIDYDHDFFLKYSKLAGSLNIDEVQSIKKAREKVAEQLGVSVDVLDKKVKPMEALYAICDHTKALAMAISDGMLPSNVGGGYNLRVILRRALGFIDDNHWNIDLSDVCSMHADHLKPMIPELKENIESVKKILEIERKRFHETKLRTKRIVEKMVEDGEEFTEEKMVRMYDSDGITPELINDFNPDVKTPEDFYIKVTEKHINPPKKIDTEQLDVEGLSETKLLFYENSKMTEFKAKVLKMIDDKWVVLDQTAFYPESGGQKADLGFIDDVPVSDTQKFGGVVAHRILGTFKESQEITGKVNLYNREILTKHHTAVHVINTACRDILGSWVWQHSAEKTTKKARLDITHYDTLTDEQIQKIEDRANEIVKKNYPVTKEVLPRDEAEKKYGFRIYQGGVAPEKMLRIVSIDKLDHEACGGTHVDNTSEIGFISIAKTKRVQDGVVRLEFVAGDVAVKELKESKRLLKESCDVLKVKEDELPKRVEQLFNEWKEKRKLVKNV